MVFKSDSENTPNLAKNGRNREGFVRVQVATGSGSQVVVWVQSALLVAGRLGSDGGHGEVEEEEGNREEVLGGRERCRMAGIGAKMPWVSLDSSWRFAPFPEARSSEEGRRMSGVSWGRIPELVAIGGGCWSSVTKKEPRCDPEKRFKEIRNFEENERIVANTQNYAVFISVCKLLKISCAVQFFSYIRPAKSEFQSEFWFTQK